MDPIVGAVSQLLAHARGEESASVFGLVRTAERIRQRPLTVQESDTLAPGTFGLWRNCADHDEILFSPWVAAPERTVAHELGHILLGHPGMPVDEAVRRTLPAEWHDVAGFMLRQCGQNSTGDDHLRRLERDAEGFASELCGRIAGAGRARSARIRSLLNEAL
ncbi:hypothetical protein [Rhodococcus sp. SGAir0479]|uniref:hypothetical protein n=1 Tax=Rhodococcus sp. SGAir0479 TaxID=2567884 RepID=UPI0010CCF55B|nr:hypothetical protein [Rhodococcus sp. SGAir0479]QCQ94163.1 hypothetical protein E7742_22925 [Rhodococcus sp. SGAir0479]